MWGTFFGGMAGFMTGGPLGALLGASVGRAFWDKHPFPRVFDPFGVLRSVEMSFSRIRAETAEATLSTALVFLAGHLASVGRKNLDHAEHTLRNLLRISSSDTPHIRTIFLQGYSATNLPYHLLHNLAVLLAKNPEKASPFWGVLTAFLNAQKPVSDEMHMAMENIAKALGRGSDGSATHHAMDLTTAYRILDLPENADNHTVRRTYHALSRQYHPDMVAASGAHPKEIAKASKRMASINAAWDEVARSRRMRP